MANSMNPELTCEIWQIIHSHVDKLNRHIPFAEAVQAAEPLPILSSLERLEHICACTPENSPCPLYEEAVQCLAAIEEFLSITLQEKNTTFYETRLGQLYVQATQWSWAASRRFRCSLAQVWKILEPAVPDCLSEVETNIYEALWWKPVPVMDIEILKRTPGIVLWGEAYEPANLPNGLAVRFYFISQPSEDGVH